MNYALTAESHTWWLPSAIAGAIGAVAIGAVLILPTLGTPEVTNRPDAPAYSRGVNVDDWCFSQQLPRHGAEQLPQPACR